MNSKNTLTWFVIAVALAAFIFIFRFLEHSTAPERPEMLPDLRATAITSVQVVPNGAPEISVSRTNSDWIMTEPIFYPAQRTAIDAFLDRLQKLAPAERISPAELRENHQSDSVYGLQSPQTSIVLQSAENSWRILVGNRTQPGDQAFIRVAGIEGIFVTDASWLKEIPQSPDDWRDTSLATVQNGCDSIILTNGAKIIELHYNHTNHLWQMGPRPLPARANGDYIANALQQLQAARVSRFVTDNPNTDLTTFGLQPANLDLWLGQGSNMVVALHLGKNSTNDSTQIFAKREGWSAIVTTPKQPLAPWYGAVNDFRDPYLFDLTTPVAEIDMLGPGTNDIILQQRGTNEWKIVGQKFPVDTGLVQGFIQRLASLRVSDFVKDVVTPADLSAYGLTAPSRRITLRSAVGDTNAVIAQLLFGEVRTNEVFVQHGGEDSIYAISPEDFNRLPEKAWQFRDQRIWNFSENDVTQITVRQNGKIRQINHDGPNKWSLAAGSQGIINPPAIEEIAHQLGNLSAEAWDSRGVSDPAIYGLKPGNLSITVTLKNGQSLTVDFGGYISKYFRLAAVTLDGERWVFVFPMTTYGMISPYLAITPDAP